MLEIAQASMQDREQQLPYGTTSDHIQQIEQEEQQEVSWMYKRDSHAPAKDRHVWRGAAGAQRAGGRAGRRSGGQAGVGCVGKAISVHVGFCLGAGRG